MARKLIVEIVGDTSSVEKAFRKTEAGAKNLDKEVGQTARGAIVGTGAFRSMGRSVAFASGAFLGGAGFIAAVKTSVGAASNLNEQTSKANVVFGESAASVEKWSQTTVNSMGLASDQALETASSFGALLRPIGLTGDAAATQARKLTQLGADLASFYNTSVQDALDAIRSGLVGESEPLRRYGVLLSETRVQQEALRETGKKHASQLTAQEKVLARIAIVYRDTSSAQGDFARTSGGLANQERIFTANLRQLEIELGQKLIPFLTKATTDTNKLIEALGKVKSLPGGNKGLIDIIPFGHVSAIDLFGDAVVRVAKGFEKAVFEAGQLSKVKLSPEQIRLFGLANAGATTGEDVGQRGAGSRTAVPGALAHPRASLTFQLSILQERLAKAELTATQRDDRAILVRIAALTRQKIAKTKELGERTRLTDTLVSVESQIAQIDQQAADARKTRREKELAAREKEHQQALAAYQQTKAQADKILAAARARVKAQNQALKDAADVVRAPGLARRHLPRPGLQRARGCSRHQQRQSHWRHSWRWRVRQQPPATDSTVGRVQQRPRQARTARCTRRADHTATAGRARTGTADPPVGYSGQAHVAVVVQGVRAAGESGAADRPR